MTVTVQFSDESQKTIVSWFSAEPPVPEQFLNLGEVETSDPRWKTYYDLLNPMSPGMPEPV